MIEIRKSVPRGMVYLYDHNGEHIVIPEYDPKQTVVASSNAISIAAISDMDGDVNIKLSTSKEICSPEKFKLFSDHLDIDTGVLSVCFMGDEKIASIPTRVRSSLVEIYGNEKRLPSSVLVIVVEDEEDACDGRGAIKG